MSKFKIINTLSLFFKIQSMIKRKDSYKDFFIASTNFNVNELISMLNIKLKKKAILITRLDGILSYGKVKSKLSNESVLIYLPEEGQDKEKGAQFIEFLKKRIIDNKSFLFHIRTTREIIWY